jgi:hypothetical protein
VYYESGELHESSPTYKRYPKEIDFDNTANHVWCFKKWSAHTATGACGVMTYRIENRENIQSNLLIMFSAPFNHDHYINWFGVGFGNKRADESLFKEIYSGAKLSGFNRRPSTVQGET